MRADDGPAAAGLDEVLFEFRWVGRCVRVAAIDPVSGTEVTVSGPAGCDEAALERVAMRKLAYVLARGERQHRPAFFA